MLSIFLYYGIPVPPFANTDLPNTGRPIGSAYCIEVLALAAPLIVTRSSLVMHLESQPIYKSQYKVLLNVINRLKIDAYNCIGPRPTI